MNGNNSSSSSSTAGHVFERDAPPEALAKHFQAHGVVVMRALSPEQCDALVEEQVREIFYKQPWTARLEVDGLDLDRDRRAFLDALTRPNLPQATREAWRACWPFHADFGACCDPNVFHLPGVWSVRQDPRLYTTATALLGGRTRLWVDINRSIQRGPDTGKTEFLHWDLHYPSRPPPADLAGLDHIGGECPLLLLSRGGARSRMVNIDRQGRVHSEPVCVRPRHHDARVPRRLLRGVRAALC
jgi:hypothetical protein